MSLLGAAASQQTSGEDPQSGKANYFTGNDPTKWQHNVPMYGKVRLQGVYPGIDLVYYGRQGRLEYDFVVAPGADAAAIKLRFDGAKPTRQPTAIWCCRLTVVQRCASTSQWSTKRWMACAGRWTAVLASRWRTAASQFPTGSL